MGPTPEPRGAYANLLFGKHFAENKIKMKEFGPGGRVAALASPSVPRLRRNKAIHHPAESSENTSICAKIRK